MKTNTLFWGQPTRLPLSRNIKMDTQNVILVDKKNEKEFEFEQIEILFPIPILRYPPSSTERKRFIPRIYSYDNRKYLVYAWDALDHYDTYLEEQLAVYICSARPQPLPSFKPNP